MGKYAANTRVPVHRTKNDIERVLERYGVDGTIIGQFAQRAYVEFAMVAEKRVVRIFLDLPREEKYRTKVKYEQAVRQAWRALYLVLKAKLESRESGIETFDEAFMPHIIMANGKTVGQQILPDFQRTLETGEMPKLLPEA